MIKCTHEWGIDAYDCGNFLEFDVDGKRIYCTNCGEEWFKK